MVYQLLSLFPTEPEPYDVLEQLLFREDFSWLRSNLFALALNAPSTYTIAWSKGKASQPSGWAAGCPKNLSAFCNAPAML